MSRTYSAKKQDYFAKLNEYFDTYEKVLVVGCDNVTSRQFNTLRIGMRPSGQYPFVGKILMGKNTMMKKALSDRAEADPENKIKQSQFENFSKLLVNNVGLVFTNDDLTLVKKVLDENVIAAAARVGAVAQCDVYIPAGPTSLEPGQTSFFQALNIHTKITKGTIDILNEVHLITVGDKVGASAATLLQKLNILPFKYGLNILRIYESGSFYSPDVLSLTAEEKLGKVQTAIANIAALSLAIGFTNKASIPHVAINAFKDIFSVSLGTDYDFEAFGAKQLKQDIKEGKVAAAPAAAATSAAAEAAPAAKAPEPESEEDDDMGMDLFD